MAKPTLQDELRYVIRKIEDQITELKRIGEDWYELTEARILERRRDEHYARLCKIDGLTPRS